LRSRHDKMRQTEHSSLVLRRDASLRWPAGLRLSVWIVSLYAIQAIGAQEPFWIQSKGPLGGAIWAITSDLNGNLYCGARAGAVFHYSEKARSWTPVFLGASRQDIVAMAADHNGRVYFAAVRRQLEG
jgi:hypothetical protein